MTKEIIMSKGTPIEVTHNYYQMSEDVTIHYVTCGSGQPLLLLHGHPQTWRMWHKVIGELAEKYTVIAADLKGYGDSSKPEGTEGHANYAKRVMAEEMIALMQHLGYEHFTLMGHDRGARVGYRMALDHPDVLDKLVLLDVVSTYDMYLRTDREFAGALFQWFLFCQPAPLPEHMIMNNHAEFFRYSLHISRYGENDTEAEAFPEEVYKDYEAHYNAETVHAVCEEYRAGEAIDRVLDQEDLGAGRKITCPVYALWGAHGLVQRFFKPIELWERFCTNVTGGTVPCGHFIPEEAPVQMMQKLWGFL